jgi:hypothetical protein
MLASPYMRIIANASLKYAGFQFWLDVGNWGNGTVEPNPCGEFMLKYDQG